MTASIAFLRKDEDSDYGVEFPDLPGCISAGRTLEEAKAMASEALTGHVSLLREMEEPVPSPSSPAQLLEAPHRKTALMVLIETEQKQSP